MNEFLIVAFSIFVLICFRTQWIASRSKSQKTVSLNPEFRKFQYRFFAPYLLALFSDWLQTPYTYRLYSQYGYTAKDISLLYITGFGSSLLFGTFTGLLADRFGRKRLCLTFCFIYSFSCLTNMSPNWWWLFCSQLLGGISTSILYSTFQAWYVCQHSVCGFPADWISSTFTISTFLNGILAILAGIIADLGADWLGFGPVAPFLTAVPFLVLSGIMISIHWNENHGSREFGLSRSFSKGLRAIFNDNTLFLLGLVQSTFESIMYVFIFLWTPVLESKESFSHWPLGLIFSCFMVFIMIGSTVNTLLLNKGVRPPSILLTAMSCATLSMTICSWATDSNHPQPVLTFLAFILLELSVGIYFPTIEFLRSKVIPEALRANIMTWLRVPLNVITCIVLYCLHLSDASETVGRDYRNAFNFNIVLGVVGILAAAAFRSTFADGNKSTSYRSQVHSVVVL